MAEPEVLTWVVQSLLSMNNIEKTIIVTATANSSCELTVCLVLAERFALLLQFALCIGAERG